MRKIDNVIADEPKGFLRHLPERERRLEALAMFTAQPVRLPQDELDEILEQVGLIQ